MVNRSDTVGREIPKEYREIVAEVVANQGWRYDASRGGHPMVFPADPSKRGIPVPTTPGSQGLLRGFTHQVRKAGGIWPPRTRTKGGKP